MDKTGKRVNPDRVRRLLYALISCACVALTGWRVLRLLWGNPADAAIILGCVAVWSIMRLDVFVIGGGRR